MFGYPWRGVEFVYKRDGTFAVRARREGLEPRVVPRRREVMLAANLDNVIFWLMRILLDIPEGSAAGFMARRLDEAAGMPPEDYALGAIERAAETDLAEVYRLFLARVAGVGDAPDGTN